MKIYLLDLNPEMVAAWEKEFMLKPDVEVVCDTFESFMSSHPFVTGIVTPANSFGLMDGGYDKAVVSYFGDTVQKDIQNTIISNQHGYQVPGTCLFTIIDGRMIFHIPTMRTPEEILDSRIVFDCMMTALTYTSLFKIQAVVIPAFGALTGKIPVDKVAKYMAFAYDVYNNDIKEITWGYALHIKNKLNEIHNS